MVKGAIEAKSALYTRDFEVVDIPALFKPKVAVVAESKPKAAIHLDIDAIGRGGLFIDNNVAQVEVALDGKIKGTPQEPQFVGTLNVVNGKVKVRRRTFTLTSGAADFRGEFPPNPNVNINAETEISTREADYLITATVTGTARAPIVHFSSDDPNLTQNDLVTLVAVGRTAADLQSESGGVTSIDALALVPTAPVEERVSQLVGIDRFEIDLAQTNSQGDVSPGVTIGKNLTDRFRAALTTTFDTDARNAVVLEYDLTRRLSVLGQWEADTESEAGAFGAGLRLRYEFRRLPFSLLGRRAEPREHNAN
jgi:autotransporter translocation and assembly factor TamB